MEYENLGLWLNTILLLGIFIILIIIVTNKNKDNFGYSNFMGLVPPRNMLAVNNLRIEAQDKGCDVDEIIRQVQLDPYNMTKAKNAVKECREKCPGLSEDGLATLANIPNYQSYYGIGKWSTN